MTVSHVFSQDTNNSIDVLYLKYGSVLRGKVIHYVPGDSITFSINGGEPVKIADKLIQKIKMGSNGKSVETYSFKENKWYTRSQFSVLYSKLNNGYSASQSVGYQFKYWLALGVGGGVDNYLATSGHNIYPIFGEIRTNLLKRNLTPYIALRYGYSIINPNEKYGQTDASGASFFNPVIGYRLGSGSPYFDVFVGMKFQDAVYNTIQPDTRSIVNFEYRRYDLGFALTF